MGHKLHTALAALLSGLSAALLASCALPEVEKPAVVVTTPPAKRTPRAARISAPAGSDQSFSGGGSSRGGY